MLDGWHGDTSRMYLVGDVPVKAKRLVDVTYECLMLGIEQAKPGNRIGDIAHAIQSHAEAHRYGVVREFCGHGLGRLFHDAPEVVHAGRPGTGPELKPGMIFTIEPMINIGKPHGKVLEDGWTAVTRDRSLSAQFEHSIGITDDGCEIFTASPKGLTSRLIDGFMLSDAISARKAVIGIFLLAALPLWLGQAWLMGLFNFSKEYPINDVKPSFEKWTEGDKDRVTFCLSKNWSSQLSLQQVRSPASENGITRFRNRPQHVVVDVDRAGGKTVVRAYKVNGRDLSTDHLVALQSCL
jgi:hypothetical protein